jgi:hypothetical protein
VNPGFNSRHDDSLCLNCNSNGHFTAKGLLVWAVYGWLWRESCCVGEPAV